MTDTPDIVERLDKMRAEMIAENVNGWPNTRVDVKAELLRLRGEVERLTNSWRCFHCDEVFTDKETAAEHFGCILDEPACKLNQLEGGILTLLRDAQRQLEEYRNETDPQSRAFYALGAKHTTELRREEELGYERGLADGRANMANETARADALQAQLDKVRPQLIASAPLDGTHIDIFINGSRVPDAWWGRPDHTCGEAGIYCDSCPTYDGWCDVFGYITGTEGYEEGAPTHWALPLALASLTEGETE